MVIRIWNIFTWLDVYDTFSHWFTHMQHFHSAIRIWNISTWLYESGIKSHGYTHMQQNHMAMLIWNKISWLYALLEQNHINMLYAYGTNSYDYTDMEHFLMAIRVWNIYTCLYVQHMEHFQWLYAYGHGCIHIEHFHIAVRISNILNCSTHMDTIVITKTCLYNFDPLKPHFYIVKLGFTGVYIIFQRHR